MTNVLIYIVDALRADHLGCYGYRRSTTPHIDALMEDPAAVRFSCACSPSTWTKPVAASLLSGCYPPAHGVRTRNDLFTRAVPRLPVLLRSAGFRTAAISTIGNVSSSLGFATGFDHFVDLYKEPSLVVRREVSNTGAWKLYYEGNETVVLPLAEDVNAYAMAWLEEVFQDNRPFVHALTGSQAGQRARAYANGQAPSSDEAGQVAPWFLLLWTLDPHDPYYPPTDFDRWSDPSYQGRVDGSSKSIRRARNQADVQRLIDLYDGEIAYMDDQFGRLVGYLRARGVYDDTLVVVAGDHGEAFGEHGDFVHGHLAYEEVMQVPLIVKLPRPLAPMRPSGQVSDDLVQLTDIAPTVLDVLGLSHLRTGMQGYSLLPVMMGRGPARAAAYAETQASQVNQRLLTVRTERWKYLRVDSPGDYTGASRAGQPAAGWRQRLVGYSRQLSNPEMIKKLLRNPMFYIRRRLSEQEVLFDLENDPGERVNVLASQPQVTEEMRAALEAWLAECRVYGNLSDEQSLGIGLDEATRRQLEGLGYL